VSVDILGVVHLLNGSLGSLVVAEVNETETSAPAVPHDNGLWYWVSNGCIRLHVCCNSTDSLLDGAELLKALRKSLVIGGP
jgi:hypothetical protein